MQTTVHDIPYHLITLVEALRAKLRDADFLARHRVRPQDFTRQRQLTFPLLMLFLLQQTVKSIQRHLHEFLDELTQGQLFEPVTSGAVTHARAKLKESAFSELNRDCVLSALYHSEHPVRRWRRADSWASTVPWCVCRRATNWGNRLAGKPSPINTGPPAPAIRRRACRSSMMCSTGRAGTRDWNPAPWAKWLWPVNSWSICSPGTLRSMIAVLPVTSIWLEWGYGRRILLLAVRPVPFWRPKSCFGSTAPTKAKSSGSSPRRTRKQSASAWGCR